MKKSLRSLFTSLLLASTLAGGLTPTAHGRQEPARPQADAVAALIAQGMSVSEDDAVQQVRSRARFILQTAANVTRKTYDTLEQTLRRSAQLPGRKIVLFISDGFLLDTANTDSSQRMKRITDAAARANAVVYTYHATGLQADMPGADLREASGARLEMQDPLYSIAEGTGGRFYKNHNDMRPDISKALVEASRYYLLAWRPDPELRGNAKLRRIEVKVKGRPELTVRLQSGYLPEESKGAQLAALKSAQEQLRTALNSFAPKTGLPTSLSANYFEAEGGPLVTAAVRVEGAAVEFTRAAEQVRADVDVVGVVYDSKGKTEATFSRRLSLNAPPARVSPDGQEAARLAYAAEVPLEGLPAGRYSLRVTVNDRAAKSAATQRVSFIVK